MPVKLSAIEGVMIEKREGVTVLLDKHGKEYASASEHFKWGYNTAIDLQGSKQIGLNRERLATFLYQRERVIIGVLRNWPTWEELPETNPAKASYRDWADAIIREEATLLEVKCEY